MQVFKPENVYGKSFFNDCSPNYHPNKCSVSSLMTSPMAIFQVLLRGQVWIQSLRITSNQLKLQAAPVNDFAYISVPNSSINEATWEFLSGWSLTLPPQTTPEFI